MLPSNELYNLWRIIERQEYFLDDNTKDPYTFGAILTAPHSRVFFVGHKDEKSTLGGHPSGLFYSTFINPGVSGIGAGIVWERDGYGQDLLIKTAIRAVVREADLHKIYSHVARPNFLGRRLAERLGFTQEGVLREGLRYNGKWTDIISYGMIARELED